MLVPIANGSETWLWRFNVKDFAVGTGHDDVHRVVVHPADMRTGSLELSNCGAKYEWCCNFASVPFQCDDPAHLRCWPNDGQIESGCSCGQVKNVACKPGADSSQPHECISPRSVSVNGVCEWCGMMGQPVCDESRAGKKCFEGLPDSSGKCSLESAGSNDGSGPSGGPGGSGAGGSCAGVPPDYCTINCGILSDGSVRSGCDPVALQESASNELGNTVAAYWQDESQKVVPTAAQGQYVYTSSYSIVECPTPTSECIKSAGTITVRQEVRAYDHATGQPVSIDCPTCVNGVQIGAVQYPADQYLENWKNSDDFAKQMADNCKSTIYRDGVCKQKLGEPMEGDEQYCNSGKKNGNVCCIDSDKGLSSSPGETGTAANCCTGSVKQKCKGVDAPCDASCTTGCEDTETCA